MTKEKKKTDLVRSVLCILAALAFGIYLGSPVPKVWAHPVSEMVSVVSEQIGKIESLHNNEKEDKTAAEKAPVSEDKKAAEDETVLNGNKENNISSATESAVEASVSEAQEEEQPDYIRPNANRGGAADRNEVDTLIRLINAEAYGRSYKTKVAVGQVVMNRWTGPYYGDDLLAIMTAPHQFTPIYNGSAYKKEVEPDSVKAAYAVLNGTGVDGLTDDTYYFVNPKFTQDKTIEQKMEFVCEIEGLHFFRPPAK